MYKESAWDGDYRKSSPVNALGADCDAPGNRRSSTIRRASILGSRASILGNGEADVWPRSIPIGVWLTTKRAIRTGHRRPERSDPARSRTGHGMEQSGATYNEQGDNDRAIADLSEAVRLYSTSAMAFDHRGGASTTRVTTTTVPLPTTVKRSGSVRNRLGLLCTRAFISICRLI
jgi:hypothetical protein